VDFQFAEDRDFFNLEKCRDFERIRSERFAQLSRQFGARCLLQFAPDCDPAGGLVVDHLIPISSNKLNKRLRAASARRDASGLLRKAPPQSFGSNHPRNCVLACHNCNSLKQNGFLDPVTYRRVITEMRAFETTDQGTSQGVRGRDRTPAGPP